MSSMPIEFDSAFRTNRLVVRALALGVAVFGAVASLVEPVSVRFEPVFLGLDVLALVAIVVTIQGVAISFFVPPRIVAAVKDGEPHKRVAAYGASRIVAAAMCEGPALLWCVAILLGGTRWYLAPVALLVVLVLQHAPTRDGFEAATGVRLGLEI